MIRTQIAHLIDVGSTWTKGLAVSLNDGRLIARRQHPTTLRAGIMQGVNTVIADLERAAAGTVVFRAATSSAAGGLRVAAIGLVPGLTGFAAKQASLGAGARVVFTGSYALEADDIEAMRDQRPDIILLTGGTNGGNTEVILKNAERLARAGLPAAVVLAGNKSARAAALALLRAGGYEVHVADNVLPAVDTLNVESAQAAIRGVFLERIVVARGIEKLREWALGVVMPTPKAVLDAAAFLADGHPGRFGTTVVVDIGGATTDVHSIGGSEPQAGIVLKGLPEPRVKRTVEGDLGLRVSAAAAADALGAEALAKGMGVSIEHLRQVAGDRVEHPGTIGERDAFDRVVAVAAVAEALFRHVGRLERLPLLRETWVQIGKDLRRADVVIGSGGVFAARADANELLDAAVREASAKGDHLVPDGAALLIDRDYVLFAVGLLAQRYPETAASLALRSLGKPQSLTKGAGDEKCGS
ncbi:MAG: glutamate mutase L [Betaproteobacteria bacterium]|nr:glutamate mutase L [Betaproteobacteria bacterium]